MNNYVVDLKIDSNYCLDLYDDFIMNEDLDLYEFIGNDPVKAFYLGTNIESWFTELEKEQKYLYSKQLRHNKDDLKKYGDQVDFWIDKFKGKDEIVELSEMSEYVINNMFYDEETEDSDRIKLSLFFGMLVAKKKNEESDNIH